MKFSLTSNRKIIFGTQLFQIKAEKNFSNVTKGELGGWIEKESNLSQYGDAWVSGDACVFGNARVSGDAMVYGNAKVCAKMNYTKGRFIGGQDGPDKVTNITNKTGSTYWDNQYVLGDYEITPQEEICEQDEIIELTLEDIAKLKGVSVDKIIIKD